MTIPLKDFSPYFFENISVKCENQFQISSVCNADCIFCSNKQNPFKIDRFGFRPLEEIEKVVWASDYIYGSIILNESLPGRISEGEALLHPQLFEILDVIRSKFDNVLNITTNGSLLDAKFIEKLSKYLPIEIVISIPSINKNYWMESFNLTEKNYSIAINSLSLLIDKGFDVKPAVVPLPSWVGYDDIEKTIKFLSDLDLKEILIYAPGFTKYTKTGVVPKLKYDKFELSSFFKKLEQEYGVVFEWALDPQSKLPVGENEITFAIEDKIIPMELKEVYFFTSTSAHERFKKLIKAVEKNQNYSTTFKVVPVENLTYGGNIECTGLWTIVDIDTKIKELNLKNTAIVLPDNFLDCYGYDIAGENMVDYIKNQTNKFILLSREEYLE